MPRAHFYYILLVYEPHYLWKIYISEFYQKWSLRIIKCFPLSLKHHTKYFKSDNLPIEWPSFRRPLGGNMKLLLCGQISAEYYFFLFRFLRYVNAVWELLLCCLG